MIHALVQGELHKDPIQRTSASGKTFVTCNIKSTSDGETVWCSVITFSEDAQTELLRLRAGDACSIQGRLKVTTYERNGEVRPSLDVVASSVQALRPKPRPKQPRQARQDGRSYDPRNLHGAGGQHQAEDGFNDPIPFG